MPSKSRQRKLRAQHPPKELAEKTVPSVSTSYQPWQIAAVCLVLAVVTVVAFQSVRANDFVAYDDDVYVQDNQQVQQGLTAQSIDWAFTTFHAANWHPLTWISHIIDWDLYGKDPGGQHMTSVYLHAANAILLFLLLLYMTGFLGRSAIVACLFALHPAHVESVAWIAERKDVLCALFWFAALLAYAWYVRGRSWKRYACVVFFFACALMSKPMAVTLPLTLLLLDYWPLRRFAFTAETRAQWFSSALKLFAEKLPLFILSIISSAITFIAQRGGGAVDSLQILPLWVRLANAAISYCHYIRLMFWPDPLIVYYLHEKTNIMASAAVLSAIALLLVTAACWYFRKQRPYCLMGWLWFLATLVPVIGIVQVGDQALAERYTYVPLIGLFIAVVWLVGDAVASSPKIKVAAQVLAIAVIAACAIKTQAQLAVWKDTKSLFSNVIAVNPRGEVPNLSLGVAYAKEKQFALAQQYLELALDYSPRSYLAHNNLGTLFNNQGLSQQALNQFQLSLAIKPDQPVVLSKVGRIFAESHRFSEALVEYTQAVRLNPTDAYAHNDLGVALFEVGDYEGAAGQFSEAVRLDPTYADAKRNLDLAHTWMKNQNAANGRK
jgi:tetratricopeptide (TPR) repeat protein